jgi:hypothetical protein
VIGGGVVGQVGEWMLEWMSVFRVLPKPRKAALLAALSLSSISHLIIFHFNSIPNPAKVTMVETAMPDLSSMALIGFRTIGYY